MSKLLSLEVNRSFKSTVLLDAGGYLKALKRPGPKIWFYDPTLPALILDPLLSTIPVNHRFALPPKEAGKSFQALEKMSAFLDSMDVTSATEIIALGGGALTDSVAFLASIYLRGLPLSLIPTTLLAMIDASIGGKTAINTHLKNRIGSFYPAQQIIIDFDFLDSMPTSLHADGMSELIKIALLFDAELVTDLEAGSQPLDAMITRAIELKLKVVENDLTDLNMRKLLNFGHTIGHALEAFHQFKYSHGQCVAAGIVLETLSHPLSERIKNVLVKYGCFKPIPYLKDDLIPFILGDKKRHLDTLDWVKLQQFGEATLENIPITHLHELIPDHY